MFDIIRNYALPEFWAFWGVPFATVVIAGLAMAFSIWLAPTLAWRRIGMEVAIVAIAGGFIYGFGGSKRDALCAAQVAAYEAKFAELEEANKRASATDRAEAEARIKTVEQDHEQSLKIIRAKLATSESGSCVPGDEYLNSVRDARTKSSRNGKR